MQRKKLFFQRCSDKSIFVIRLIRATRTKNTLHDKLRRKLQEVILVEFIVWLNVHCQKVFIFFQVYGWPSKLLQESLRSSRNNYPWGLRLLHPPLLEVLSAWTNSNHQLKRSKAQEIISRLISSVNVFGQSAKPDFIREPQ